MLGHTTIIASQQDVLPSIYIRMSNLMDTEFAFSGWGRNAGTAANYHDGAHHGVRRIRAVGPAGHSIRKYRIEWGRIRHSLLLGVTGRGAPESWRSFAYQSVSGRSFAGMPLGLSWYRGR